MKSLLQYILWSEVFKKFEIVKSKDILLDVISDAFCRIPPNSTVFNVKMDKDTIEFDSSSILNYPKIYRGRITLDSTKVGGTTIAYRVNFRKFSLVNLLFWFFGGIIVSLFDLILMSRPLLSFGSAIIFLCYILLFLIIGLIAGIYYKKRLLLQLDTFINNLRYVKF
jgi:hypothetical protein